MSTREPAKKGDYEYGTDECGPLAWWRPCHNPGRDKGAFTPGRGYTSYHKKEIPVCSRRQFHGCPSGSWTPRDDGTQLSRQPDPDWREMWAYVQSLKGAKRWKWTLILVRGLIESVQHWRKLASGE